MNFNWKNWSQTPELQNIAVKVLSQVTSAGSCERNWSTFDFIHSKKRNKLACATVKNIVKVHCNLRLVGDIEMIGHSDANIEWSSSDEDLDWLTVLNFYELYYVSNIMNCYELYSKLFELHNYGRSYRSLRARW